MDSHYVSRFPAMTGWSYWASDNVFFFHRNVQYTVQYCTETLLISPLKFSPFLFCSVLFFSSHGNSNLEWCVYSSIKVDTTARNELLWALSCVYGTFWYTQITLRTPIWVHICPVARNYNDKKHSVMIESNKKTLAVLNTNRSLWYKLNWYTSINNIYNAR